MGMNLGGWPKKLVECTQSTETHSRYNQAKREMTSLPMKMKISLHNRTLDQILASLNHQLKARVKK